MIHRGNSVRRHGTARAASLDRLRSTSTAEFGWLGGRKRLSGLTAREYLERCYYALGIPAFVFSSSCHIVRSYDRSGKAGAFPLVKDRAR
jgi:hypothetical protein